MKELLRLPALLFLFLLLFLLLFTGIQLLAVWGVTVPQGSEAALQAAGARFLPALRQALPAALLLALAMLLFRGARRPTGRGLSLLVPLPLAFLVLVLGYGLLAQAGSRAEGAAAEAQPSLYLRAERFIQVGNRVIYASALEGERLRGVAVYDPLRSAPRLSHTTGGAVTAAGPGIRLQLRGGTSELAVPPLNAPLFAGDPILAPLLEDVRLLDLELARLHAESLSGFLLLSFALVFAFLGAGFFVRLGRWPLLNAVLALLVLRGYLMLLRLLSYDLAGQLRQVFASPGIPALAPALVLLILGALFVLIDLLFLPGERRRPGHA